MPIVEDANINKEELFEFFNLKEKFARKENFLIAEGPRIVARLLKSNLIVDKIISDETQLKYLVQNNLITSQQISDLNIFIINKNEISEIVGYKIHQGILASAARPEPILPHDLIFPALALNKISNSENVGSILRTASAFGIKNIIIDKETCDPYLRRCIRVSMGAAFEIKVLLVDNLAKSIAKLKKQYDCTISSLEITEKSKSIYSFHKTITNNVIVLGSEFEGVNREIIELSDHVIHIPIERGSVSSLNVTVACGILLSHLRL